MNKKIMAIALASVAAGALVGVTAYGQTIRNAAIVTDVKVPTRADNFRLTDQHSKAHELYYFKNSAAVVIITQANGAQYIKDAAPAIKALKDKYAGQNVTFLMLNSSLTDSPKAVAAEMKKIGLDVPVLTDDAQLIGENLGVTRVAQAFVIHPKTWSVVYSGPIDDRFAGATAKPNAPVQSAYVANALDNLIAGKSVAASTVQIDSPTLSFPKRDRQADFSKISYSKEIAPILAKNCVSCHAEGGIAPFAMNSYETVKGFAPMIREAIRTDRMPPFNADPHVGAFKNNMNMSNSDLQTLVHWVEAGSPRGDGEDYLKVNAKAAPEWELGEPDIIMDVPNFTIPASGVVDYERPVLTIPVSETRWLKAITFNIGQRKGVHHIVAPMAEYAVGAESQVFPEGQGMEITPNMKMPLSMHYTPFGKEAVDVSKIGLYFFPEDKTPDIIRRHVVISNPNIEILANAPRHQEVASVTFPRDATMYSLLFHGHYRTENSQVFLKKPGGQEEMIASLPKFDFSWQRGYYFEKPIDVPAGSILITRYEWDNSKDNPANPDPTKNVLWGEQSWEEMQYTVVGFTWKGETVANPKPEYMKELNNSRALGLLDLNYDGQIAKDELRGRSGKAVLAKFDAFDTDKNGLISKTEAASLLPTLNRRITEAEENR